MTVFSESQWRAATSQPYPAPGDPVALAAVAAALYERRDAAMYVHDQLASLGSSTGQWEGEAADAFRDSLGKLIPNLAKATDSFGQAGDAVTAFRSELGGLQARADAVRPSLQQAEAAQRSAQFGQYSFDAAAHNEWARAHNALVPILHQVEEIESDYRALVRTCASRLDGASHAGIRNSFWTWFGAHEKGLKKIADWSEKIADGSGNLELAGIALAAILASTGIGAPVAGGLAVGIAFLVVVNRAATVVKGISDIGLATAEHDADGKVSTDTEWSLGEDALSAVLMVPLLSPGKQIVRGIAKSQITKQAEAGEAALAAKDRDGFRQASVNVHRINVWRKQWGKLAEDTIDDGIEEGVKRVGKVFDPPERKAVP